MALMEEKDKKKGHLHPMTLVINDVVSVFNEMGFEVNLEAPDIDTEWNVFDGINVPQNHPARDMQDTFWIKDKEEVVLRSHVSNTQTHYISKNKPPFKIVYFGRAFRAEATDATHEAALHQFEVLAVGKDINLGNMKAVIEKFIGKLFGGKREIRFRPGYFPFVEPGVEVDMRCLCEGGEGCRICKGEGWVEILGAGCVHPNVLNRGGINPKEWQGFAFGVGWERIAMLRYGIEDVRSFQHADLRQINQF